MPGTTAEDVKGGVLETLLSLITGADATVHAAGLSNTQIDEKALGAKNHLLDYLSRQGALAKSIGANNPWAGNAQAPGPEQMAQIDAARQDFLMKELVRQALLRQQQMNMPNQFNPNAVHSRSF